MKVFISEQDRQNARRVALVNIAQFFGIKNIETKDNNTLFSELASLKLRESKIIFQLLSNYFLAYDKWFDFYQEIDQEQKNIKKEIELDLNQKSQLNVLIDNRETTLNQLQQYFDKLQFSRFNKNMFGKGLSGIIS
jgi:hypothetical protein